MCNKAENSDAFICNEQADVMIENSSGDDVGREILRLLENDDGGEYLSAQRVTVNDEHYLVFAGEHGTLGLFVQYAQ